MDVVTYIKLRKKISCILKYIEEDDLFFQNINIGYINIYNNINEYTGYNNLSY